MAKFRITRSAEADLEDAWLFIAQDSPLGADRFLERIHDQFLLLAEHPGIGRKRKSSGREVRGSAGGRYVILYTAVKDGIEVLRIVSGQRDLDILDEA